MTRVTLEEDVVRYFKYRQHTAWKKPKIVPWKDPLWRPIPKKDLETKIIYKKGLTENVK
jgi:hypothetical protein